MEPNLALVTLSGVMAGILHVMTGPDHLAAVAPLSTRTPQGSGIVGASWGIGHTGSTWLIALCISLVKNQLPIDFLSAWSERLVGIVLIFLGIWSFSVVNNLEPSPVGPDRTYSKTSFGIGVLHGIAGSSHYTVLLPILVLPGLWNAIAYMLGFGIGTVAFMSSFAWLIGIFAGRFGLISSSALEGFRRTMGAIAIGVGFYWLFGI